MSIDPVRNAAVTALLAVFERDAYLNIAVDRVLGRSDLSQRGSRFLTQLVYGTVRHKTLCDHVLRRLVKQPIEDLPAAILTILRMGVFQSLFCNEVPHPAMVNTSVDLAHKRGHAGTARLVNAVLRRVPQRIDDVRWPDRGTAPLEYLAVRYSMPDWLVRNWANTVGIEEAERLCGAYSEQAPVTFRVNTLKVSRDDLMPRMTKSGFRLELHRDIPDVLTLLDGPAPSKSKWFQEGLFVIEDAASTLPPHLVEPEPGERVLDLCAAPGVKTIHLAELARDQASVVALDVHAHKLALVRENVARLGLTHVQGVCGDAIHPPVAAGFDRVLVDAPCSGLGTIRRRPDLKWRVTAETPARMAEIQRALLRSAMGLCKNGGVVVYSVCTFSPEETDAVVEACLADGGVRTEDGPPWLAKWKTNKGRYRTSPLDAGLDGFFLTRLRKES